MAWAWAWRMYGCMGARIDGAHGDTLGCFCASVQLCNGSPNDNNRRSPRDSTRDAAGTHGISSSSAWGWSRVSTQLAPPPHVNWAPNY
eukprot:scaffold216995_cov28-Tisochrysis_lutea.AAC.1